MSASTKSTAAKARPIHELRLGRIKAAVWESETKFGMRYNVTIQRIYKDGNEWRQSDSFGRDDLPLVAKVADLAHTWIFEQGSNRNADEVAGEEEGANSQ